MTQSEEFQFAEVVRGLERVFPKKRFEEHERTERLKVYAKAFRRFSLAQVSAGADAWLARGKFFPKPAEWIDAMPKQRASVEIPAMTTPEAEDYRRAERLRYEDAPCVCIACKQADVTEKALRFVPTYDADGQERRMRDGDRIVTAGHWAHGRELAGWYRAKADFYDAMLKRFGMDLLSEKPRQRGGKLARMGR